MKKILVLFIILILAAAFFVGEAATNENAAEPGENGIDLSKIETEQRLTPHFAGAASITINVKGNGPIEMETSGEYEYAAIFFDPEEGILSLRETDILDDLEVGKPHYETQKFFWEAK
jgi:hypothetical protein